MKLLFLILACLTTGCAQTVVYYPSGQKAVSIQADASNVTFKGQGVYFHADTLNHSEPTRAAYSGIGTAVGAVATGVVAGAAVLK